MTQSESTQVDKINKVFDFKFNLCKIFYMNTSCQNQECCLMSIICFAVWWLISSGLLFITWNRIISTQVKVKPVKFWQAIIFVATLVSFCGPSIYMKKHSCHENHKCMNRHCNHEHGDKNGNKENSEHCPYSKKSS